jgi:hypothetical protein
MGGVTRATANEQRPTSGDLRTAGDEWRVVTSGSCELRAAGDECLATNHGQRAASGEAPEKSHLAGSNKPMVPTAPTAPKELSPTFARRRQHIGQPLGAERLGIERWRNKSWATKEATSDERRAAASVG